MEREELERYILETYNAQLDYPWEGSPRDGVFRHSANNKWFALMMVIPRARLGLSGEGEVDIVTVKCDPMMVGSLRAEPGFFPAYHMNKDKWITMTLDGAAPADKIKILLDMSFDLTNVKVKKPCRSPHQEVIT